MAKRTMKIPIDKAVAGRMLRVACEVCGASMSDVLAGVKMDETVRARRIYCRMLLDLNLSFADIQRIAQYRSHSAAVEACRIVDKDETLLALYQKARERMRRK